MRLGPVPLVPIVLLAAVPLAAQTPRATLDVSFGADEGVRVGISTMRTTPIFQGRGRLGVALRGNLFTGSAESFTNRGAVIGGLAPAMTIEPWVGAAALAVVAEGRLGRGWRAGMNLDVVGVALGPTRTTGTVEAKPARWSSFRYGNRDRGSLNSEFYASYDLSNRLTVRAGFSHYVLGYEATDPSFGTSRYQKFFTTSFVALTVKR